MRIQLAPDILHFVLPTLASTKFYDHNVNENEWKKIKPDNMRIQLAPDIFHFQLMY